MYVNAKMVPVETGPGMEGGGAGDGRKQWEWWIQVWFHILKEPL
jgi:hypothetical protein